MKHFKNLFLVMLMAFIVFVVVGCGGSEIELSFEPKTYTVEVGAELTLAPKVVNEDEIEYKLVYSSADDKIATYVNGVVKGVKAGTVKVKVAWEKKQSVFAEATITVTAKAEVKEYTVSFNVDGGGEIANATVKEGAKLAKPADPTKGGHVFEGWFKDEAKTVEYDFDAPVNANLVLYAKWSLAEYTVTFDAKGGSAVTAAGVNHGEKVAKPADPTKDHNTFEGWFTDEALATAYDFDAAVTGDLTLYAKWELVSYRVGFSTYGGSNVAAQNVKHGEKATKPADPTKDDYVFKGWFSDVELENAYDFDAVVTGALALHAKWELDMTNKVTTEFVLDGGGFGIVESEFFFGSVEGKKFTAPAGYNVTTGEYYQGETAESNHANYIFISDSNYNMAPAQWGNRAFVKLNANGLYEVIAARPAGSAENSPNLPRGEFDYVIFAHSAYAAGYAFIGTLQEGELITLSGFNFADLESFEMGDVTVAAYPADSVNLGEPVILGKDAVLPTPEKPEFAFGGWYDNAAFTGSQLVKPIDGKVYAKWVLPTYNFTLELNGGAFEPAFINALRLEVITEFLTDIYNFIDLSLVEGLADVDLNTFLHGVGKTEGLDGLFAVTDVWSQVFAKNDKTVNPSTGKMLSQPEYNAKWMPLVDIFDLYISSNPDQGFWIDPFVTSVRIKPFIKKTNLWGSWINMENFNYSISNVPMEYIATPYTEESDDIELPVPVKAEQVFLGWYDNAEFTGTPFTKVEKGTKENKAFFAKWDDIKFDVEFESNGGPAVDPQVVVKGQKVVKPVDPIREGFLFNGWFKDAALTQAYDFDAAVTGNLKLYASWTEYVVVEVDYQAHVNETREMYYIRVTFPIDLLETDIKTIHTYMAAGVLVDPVELGIVAGDPYLWFGVAKLDGINTLKENGRYAYKVVLLDDTVMIFYLDYDRDLVTHLPERLNGVVAYNGVFNATLETYFIKITVPEESLHVDAIKSIRTIKVAGELVTPVNLTPNTDTVMWFSVADYLGVLGPKQPGVYGYEVVREDDTKYVFEFEYDPQLVTDLPETQEAVIDYEAVWNETRETWYIEITTPEDLDETTIKSISLLKEAGVYLSTPVELIPDTDKVMWFGVAKQDGDLAFKGNGEYIYKVVRQDDSTYVFRFVYDSALVEGILHTIEFESNEGSVVDPLVVEKRELAEKPVDPTRLGYTFKGWFKDAALTQAFDWAVPVNANYTLYAKWEIVEYSYSLDARGGSLALYSSHSEMVAAFMLDFNAYFSEKPDVDASAFQASTYQWNVFTIFSDSVYGPKWNWMRNYLIQVATDQGHASASTLASNDDGVWRGSIDSFLNSTVRTAWPASADYTNEPAKTGYLATLKLPESAKYTVITEDITLPVPVKAGFNFLGWFDNPALSGTALTKIEKGSTGNLALYAKWDDSVEVSTYAELVAALANNDVLTIYLLNDIVLEAKLVLARNDVTIIGNGFKLSLANVAGWQGDYILQVYMAKNVTLVDLGFDGGDAALLVNGSTVKLEGTITLQNHEFGGIEVSLGSGVTTELVLELADGYVLVFADESYGRPAIWEDKVADHLIGASALIKVEGFKPNQVHYYLDVDNTLVEFEYELNGGMWGWTGTTVTAPGSGIDADSNLPEIFMQDFYTWLVENDLLDSEIVAEGLRQSDWDGFSADYDDPRAVYNYSSGTTAGGGGGYPDPHGYNLFFYDTASGEDLIITELVGGFLGSPGFREKYATVVQHLTYLLSTKYTGDAGYFYKGNSSKAAGAFVLDGYFYGTQGLTSNAMFNAFRGLIPTPSKGYHWVENAAVEYEYDFLKEEAKDGASFALSVPSREGYFFKGWFDNPEFTGTRVVSIAAGQAPAAKYYAKWELVDFEKVDQQKILVDASLDKLPGEIFAVNGVYYQEGFNAFKDFANVAANLRDGMTINVASGTYAEALVINKDNVTILGPNAGIAAGKVNTARGDEAIMTKVITVSGVEGLRIDGIALTGAAQIRSTTPVKNVLIENVNAYAPNISGAEGVVFFAAASASLTNEDIIIRNSAFNDSNGTGYRAIRINNSVNLEILNNYIYGYVDAIRLEGQNNAALGTGLGSAGKLYINNNVFEEGKQYPVWIGATSGVELQINNNSFHVMAAAAGGFEPYGFIYVHGVKVISGITSTMEVNNNDFLNTTPDWHNIRFNAAMFTPEQLTINVNGNRFHEVSKVWGGANPPRYYLVANHAAGGTIIDATGNYFLFEEEVLPSMFLNATLGTVLRQGVAQYSGATGNMAAAPANNAETVGLNADLFTVLSVKNAPSNQIGLNTSGQIRLYGNKQDGNGNALSVAIASGYKIIGVEFEFVASTNGAIGELKLGSEVVNLAAADVVNKVQTYNELDITEFSLQNVHQTDGSIGQIWIKSITITYVVDAE